MMQLRSIHTIALLAGFVTMGCASAPEPEEEKRSRESHLDDFGGGETPSTDDTAATDSFGADSFGTDPSGGGEAQDPSSTPATGQCTFMSCMQQGSFLYQCDQSGNWIQISNLRGGSCR